VQFVHLKFAPFYATLVGVPIVNAIVLINAGADAAGVLERMHQRFERFSERAWAILLIDAGVTLVGQIGYDALAAHDYSVMLQGMIVMFLAAMLVYAEPYAALENEVNLVTLLPSAILRSMMLAWVNVSRVFALFAVQIALAIVQILLLQGMAHAGARSLDLMNLAYVTFTAAPLSALFAVAYLDTLAQEHTAAP
jgi:hypothetical protein